MEVFSLHGYLVLLIVLSKDNFNSLKSLINLLTVRSLKSDSPCVVLITTTSIPARYAASAPVGLSSNTKHSDGEIPNPVKAFL